MEYPLGWYFIGLLSFQTECIVEQKIKREPYLFTDMNSHFFIMNENHAKAKVCKLNNC